MPTTTKVQDFLNLPLVQVTAMQRAAKAGDLYGLELECEGKNVDFCGEDAAILRDWAPHRDGSLRDHHGTSCEWVFNGPVTYKKSVERVDKLFDYFSQRKAKLVCSNRTSFHVHFNVGDKNVYQLLNLFILFTIVEDLLDGYCGDDRRGNLFCLSSRHAEEQVRWVEQATFKHMSFAHFREDWRYCSMNLAAINKFGTVEFRAMRGLDSKEDVLAWLNILKELCEYACYTMKNPVDLVESISMRTPRGFLQEVFSKDSFDRLAGNLTYDQVNSSVYEGLRLVQMLTYKIGTEFDKVRLRGRDFWAGFAGEADPEPVLDVDPQAILAGAGGAKPARARIAPPLRFGNNGAVEFVPPVPQVEWNEFRNQAEVVQAQARAMAAIQQGLNAALPHPAAKPAIPRNAGEGMNAYMRRVAIHNQAQEPRNDEPEGF